MKEFQAVERYSRSVFELAEEKHLAETLVIELGALKTAMEKQPQFLGLLRNPLVSRDEKRVVVHKALGTQASPLVAQFLALLIKKGRINLFPSIVERLHGLLNEKKGYQEATVVAARDLGSQLLQKIRGALEKVLKKKVLVEFQKNPLLLGGIQIRVGNRLIDGSLRTKLDTLESQLKAVKI